MLITFSEKHKEYIQESLNTVCTIFVGDNRMDARIFVFASLLFIFGFSSYPDSSEIESLDNPVYLQAALGDSESQFALGNQYHAELGANFNLQKAKHWYRIAGKNGHAESQTKLGMIYIKQKNYSEAITWLRLAALQDHPPALFQMAKVYDLGMGVLINKGRAHSLYFKAASLGNLDSMVALSLGLVADSADKLEVYTGCVWGYRADLLLHQDADRDLKDKLIKIKQKCENTLSKKQLVNIFQEASAGINNYPTNFKKLMSSTH